jgi:hypothetical protein
MVGNVYQVVPVVEKTLMLQGRTPLACVDVDVVTILFFAKLASFPSPKKVELYNVR